MIWFLFAIMLLAAALVVAWPLYREERRLTFPVAGAVIAMFTISAVVYSSIGTPVPPAAQESFDEMVAALERRMQENPEDVEGWRMLGRSYVQLQNFPRAVAAFERAAALETPPSAQTLAELGEALLIEAGDGRSGRSGELFEAALATDPGNPKALFYGGVVAIEKGDAGLAADRWEALLAQGPPPEIADVLRQRIAEWRGGERAVAKPAAAPAEGVVVVDVSLSAAAAAAVPQDATVFIIARDPGQPSPPIAVARRVVSELPAQVSLSDADAMLPGRPLSALERLEIVARVSATGEPAARPGDWYGDEIVDAPAPDAVEIVIERQVN